MNQVATTHVVRKKPAVNRSSILRQLNRIKKSATQKSCPGATPEQKAQVNAFLNDRMDKMFQSMPIDDLMQVMMPVYQHHFTHGEMQELIRFNSSPVGKKLLAEIPAIMTESMQAAMPIIQKWQSGQMDDLQTSVLEYAKTLKADKTPPASLSQPLN